jgi:hypothetical protein
MDDSYKKRLADIGAAAGRRRAERGSVNWTLERMPDWFARMRQKVYLIETSARDTSGAKKIVSKG